MHAKIRTLICCIFLSLLSHLIFPAVGCCADYDYRVYNRHINDAELAICCDNFRRASELYQKAFSAGRVPSATDLENALLVSINIRDKKQSIRYMKLLTEVGVGRAYFEKKQSLSWLHTLKEWPGILKDAEIHKTLIEKENAEILAALRTMESISEKIAQYYSPKGRPREKNWKADPERTKQMYGITMQLLEIFKVHGYLSFKKIGVNVSNDTMIQDPIFAPIIKRSYYLFDGSDLIGDNDFYTPILTSAVKGGLADSRFQIVMLSNQFSKDLNEPSLYLVDDEIYVNNNWLQFTGIELFNQKRIHEGLSTFEEIILKLKYQLKNQDQMFDFYLRPFIYRFKNEESAKQINANFFKENSKVGAIFSNKQD